MAQWVCTICGYSHIGEEPPDSCPRCGARRIDFIEIE
jgi:rubrerythrin